MHKKIAAAFMAITIAFLPLCVYAQNPQNTDISSSVSDSEIRISNNQLELSFSKETGEIAVLDKNAGEKLVSSSNFSIKTNSHKGEITFNTYEHCFVHDGISVNSDKNSLLLSYHISDGAKLTKVDLPAVITATRFKEVIEKNVDNSDLKTVKRRYEFISKDVADQEQIKKYPSLKKDDVYVLRKIEDFIAENLLEIFYDKAGYTAEDLKKDNEENNVKVDELSKKLFIDIDVEYKLSGDCIEVVVKNSEMKSTDGLSIIEISLLSDFTKANVTDEGFVFYPDGNGAISYHNQRAASRYGQTEIQIYGEDRAIRTNKKFDTYEKAILPVFGFKVNKVGVLGVINQGAEIASIIIGGNDSFSNIYPKFSMMPSDTIDFGGSSATTSKVYPKEFYKSDISVSYFFLNDAENGYVQMANRFRKHLKETDNLPETDYKSDMNIDIVVSVKKESAFLGLVPYKKQVVVTKPEDILDMASFFNTNGIENVTFNLVGWQKGALNSSVSDKPINSITKKLPFLSKELKKKGYEIYLNTNAISFENGRGISKFKDTVKYIGNNTVTVSDFDFVTGDKNTRSSDFYLLDTRKLGKRFEKYLNRISKTGVNNLSFNDLGDLSSNFKSNKLYSRTDSMTDIIKQIQQFNGKYSLMTSAANYPLIKYSDNLYNIPLKSSNLNITGLDVPFFAIVYRGYIPFSGEPINLAGDYRKSLLNSVESGSALAFKFSAAESSVFKGLDQGKYYSVDFEDWKEKISYINKKYDIDADLKIINHYCIQPNVFVTEFEENTRIYTNYNTYDIKINDLTVKSMDFEIER